MAEELDMNRTYIPSSCMAIYGRFFSKGTQFLKKYSICPRFRKMTPKQIRNDHKIRNSTRKCRYWSEDIHVLRGVHNLCKFRKLLEPWLYN